MLQLVLVVFLDNLYDLIVVEEIKGAVKNEKIKEACCPALMKTLSPKPYDLIKTRLLHIIRIMRPGLASLLLKLSYKVPYILEQ